MNKQLYDELFEKYNSRTKDDYIAKYGAEEYEKMRNTISNKTFDGIIDMFTQLMLVSMEMAYEHAKRDIGNG